MSEHPVAALYDALHAFESHWRRDTAYPVHKKLRFHEPGTNDVYDWLMDRLDLPDHGNILDAGCGVGFGTIRLAQNSTSRVTGISLSGDEIATAYRAAVQANLTDRVMFRRMSFDDLPRQTYDLVVAVESLKHSFDLHKTLRAIVHSIKDGGQLVIVEDLHAGEARGAIADKVARDWALKRLYAEADYTAVLGPSACSVVDLSDGVRRAGKLALLIQLGLLQLLLPFAGAGTAEVLRVFRGGLYLQRLYADGAMVYRAIFCRIGQQGPS